jgi:hypothetical protein
MIRSRKAVAAVGAMAGFQLREAAPAPRVTEYLDIEIL